MRYPCRAVIACVFAPLVALGEGDRIPGAAVGWQKDGTGNYPDATPVINWSATDNVVWKTPLPSWSNATPVIAGKRIFVCSEPSTLLCADLATGRIVWRQDAPQKSQPKPKTHGTTGYSTPTPATDGRSVFVLYGTGVAARYDLDGSCGWIREVGRPANAWGHSASPVLVGDHLVLHLAGHVLGLDSQSGEERWRTPSEQSWGSLVQTRIYGTDIVITSSGDLIRVRDGRKLARKIGSLNYNAPVVRAGVVYFADGQQTTGAFRLPPLADGQTLPEALWRARLPEERYYAGPLLYGGLLYAVSEKANLSVLDARTGKEVYRKRLGLEGTVYPSITGAGKYVFVSSDSGQTVVLETNREYSEVARNQLEGFRSCPVFRGDRMYVRTQRHLYCIGATESAPSDRMVEAEVEPVPRSEEPWVKGLPAELLQIVEVPSETKDAYGNPVRKGANEKTGWPLEIRHRATGMHLVFVPAGEFTMGSNDGDDEEKPVHKVVLTRPFYLGKYETTQAEWQKVMGYNPSKFKGPDKPVGELPWADCQDFFAKLNAPLRDKGGLKSPADGTVAPRARIRFAFPTEAQWEYACRAGSVARFCFGDSDADLGQYGWFWGNSVVERKLRPAKRSASPPGGGRPSDGGADRGKQRIWDWGSSRFGWQRLSRERSTQEVGGKKPNSWGLYDMHGNVWEWCEDWYAPYSPEAATDPSGPLDGACHISRGGNWLSFAATRRSARREGKEPGFRNLGCRVSLRFCP